MCRLTRPRRGGLGGWTGEGEKPGPNRRETICRASAARGYAAAPQRFRPVGGAALPTTRRGLQNGFPVPTLPGLSRVRLFADPLRHRAAAAIVPHSVLVKRMLNGSRPGRRFLCCAQPTRRSCLCIRRPLSAGPRPCGLPYHPVRATFREAHSTHSGVSFSCAWCLAAHHRPLAYDITLALARIRSLHQRRRTSACRRNLAES